MAGWRIQCLEAAKAGGRRSGGAPGVWLRCASRGRAAYAVHDQCPATCLPWNESDRSITMQLLSWTLPSVSALPTRTRPNTMARAVLTWTRGASVTHYGGGWAVPATLTLFERRAPPQVRAQRPQHIRPVAKLTSPTFAFCPKPGLNVARWFAFARPTLCHAWASGAASAARLWTKLGSRRALVSLTPAAEQAEIRPIAHS